MVSGYYEQRLATLKQLAEEDPGKAHEEIMEECAMPYVPSEFLKAIQALDQQLERPDQPLKHMDQTMIEHALVQGDEAAMAAIRALTQMNLRQDPDFLKHLLEHETIAPEWIRMILLCAQQQQIDAVYRVRLVSGVRQVNPAALIHPLESDVYQQVCTILEARLQDHDPSLLMLAKMQLQMVLSALFPDLPDGTAAPVLADHVLSAVMQAIGAQDA